MIEEVFRELGSTALFYWKILTRFLFTRGNSRPIFQQMAQITYRSLPTVGFAGIFVGAILVLQFNLMLVKYDAQSFLGGLNTSAVVRQVGPLIISFLLGGKIGAFTAAELGTMRVTEQIDAIQCLGTDPIQYLIVPRFIGIVFSGVILLIVGLMISVIGSMGIASLLCGVNVLQFATSVPRFLSFSTVLNGIIQAATYSTIVAGVCCYKGFNTTGGARGVGKAVTSAAICTNLYIVAANFLISQLAEAISSLGGSFGG